MALEQDMQKLGMAPQGSPPAPMPPQGMPQQMPQDDGDLDGVIQENLDSLNDEMRAFVAEMLTPETVKLVALLGGGADGYKDIEQRLLQYANQDRMLIPVTRQQAEELFGGMQDSSTTAGSMGDTMPPAQPSSATSMQPPAA
jgi:hypothetical protein